MNSAQRETVDKLVGVLAAKHSGSWKRIVACWSVALDEDGDYEHSVLLFALERSDGDVIETQDVVTGFDDTRLVEELHRSMSLTEPTPWWTMDLIINSDGAYVVDFSYEPVDLLDPATANPARYEDYLDRYKAETGS